MNEKQTHNELLANSETIEENKSPSSLGNTPTPSSHARTMRWSTAEWIGIVIATVAAIASAVQGYGTIAALQEQNRIANLASQEEWQRMAVFRVVRDIGGSKGLTLAEIKPHYVTEVNAAKLNLPSDELQDIAVDRVLVTLESNGLIYRTIEKKYLANLSIVNPRFEATFAAQEAKVKLLNELAASSGKHSVGELLTAAKLSGDDAIIAVNELAAGRYVLIDENGKVHSVLKPPAKDTQE